VFARRFLLSVLVMAAMPAALRAQNDPYWLVVGVTGQWEYRTDADAPRALTGAYEPISPRGQVRCLETDISRCELRYLTSATAKTTQRLPVKLVDNKQWATLSGLKPPPLPVIPASSSELASKYSRVTRAGGSRAATACGGEFPLKAPTCGENVDLSGFTIRWPATTIASIAILVERADGQNVLYRGHAAGSDGRFSDSRLTAFLVGLQTPTESVDIVVRVLAEGKSAVRMVHIPPAARSAAFESRAKTVGRHSEAARAITLMSLAMEENMLSRAADEATRVLALAGSSLNLLEHALVGFCQSDYQDEKARILKAIPARRYTEICATESRPAAPLAVAAPSAPAAPPAPVTPAVEEVPAVAPSSVARSRTGIALVIGNSDYWNLPLNSVKNDIRSMEETLRSLGFAVTTKENLRSPRQFGEVLDEVLKRENATPDDVLLLYYSGHGVQLDGKAHLLTTGVSGAVRAAEDLRDNAESAEDLLAQMERSIPGTRIFIVEACRNDILSTRPATGARGGFAFQQDDVPNTFVMFANKPGLPAAARSDYGLMGPFTEALVYALQTSTGTVQDVYTVAAEKARQISPSQEPMLYASKSVTTVTLGRTTAKMQDRRATELLNSAERLYVERAWEEFRATLQRGKALASNAQLVQRMSNEVEFASLVMSATSMERERKWAEAAEQWQKAQSLFVRREWAALNAAVAWLLADNTSRAVATLAVLATQSETDVSRQARQMLTELTTAFPALAAEAQRIARAATRLPEGQEFERIANEVVK
jgi:caspase domain-containing protein